MFYLGFRGAACENRTRDLLITSEPFLALASNNATKDDSKRPDQRSNTANEKRLALRAVCILCVLARYFDGVPIMGIVASGHRSFPLSSVVRPEGEETSTPVHPLR